MEPDSLRFFDTEAIAQYQEDKDFDYIRTTAKGPSLWARIIPWLVALVATILGEPQAAWLVPKLFYALVIVMVGVAVYYFIKLRYGHVFQRSSNHISRFRPVTTQAENVDYDQLIYQATSSGQIALALRYQYLKSLELLADKKLIQLKPWKTRIDYIKQLSDPVRGYFDELALLFEYAWYGEFEADQEDLEKGTVLTQKIEKGVG